MSPSRKEYRPWVDNVQFGPSTLAVASARAPSPLPSSAPPAPRSSASLFPSSPPPRFADRPWLEKVRLDSTPPTFRDVELTVPTSRVVWVSPARAALTGLVLAAMVGVGLHFAHRIPGPIDSLDYELPAAAALGTAPEPRVGHVRADVSGRDLSAGTASVVNFKTVTLLLTAHHAVAPPGRESDARLLSRELSSMRMDGHDAVARRPLYLEGTGSGPHAAAEDDVAAFVVEHGERAPTLSEALPVAGQALTLAQADGKRLTARVVEVLARGVMAIELDGEPDDAADGAPLYTSQGELAGLYLRRTPDRGKGCASAVTSTALRTKLEKAIL